MVFVPGSILFNKMVGDDMRLYTYHVVREQSQELYGFLTKVERDVYEMLLSVSGVGPKTALSILNAASVSNLLQAIGQGDDSILHSVSGIGKKTAAKIVIELQNKVDNSFIELATPEALGSRSDVIQALLSLGYTDVDARWAIKQIPDTITQDEAILKEALRVLNSR